MEDIFGEFTAEWIPPSNLQKTLKKQRESFLPSTYNSHSLLQLRQPLETDTTDRTLVWHAKDHGFDPEGYMEDRQFSKASPSVSTQLPPATETQDALRKSVFYTSPFLTCMECNSLLFVDASMLRSGLNLRGQIDDNLLPNEALPACHTCGSTAAFMVGAEDLTDVIQASREEIQRRLAITKKAVRKIQQFYRRYLMKRYGRAFLDAGVIQKMLFDRSATAIQALARGRLGRRTYWTEKALSTIKEAHPILMAWAFSKKAGTKKVFWYRTAEELNVLFEDYRVLVERKGYIPPRFIVEENIKEVARRILERQSYLVIRVQKRFRGVSVRKYLKVFKREKMWLREWQCANAFILQKAYRAWVDRKIPRKIRIKNKLKAEKEAYLDVKKEKIRAQEREHLMKRILGYYQQERNEEQTARYMGKLKALPSGKGAGKMMAFAKSAYARPELSNFMQEHYGSIKAEMDKESNKRKEERNRNDFISTKIDKGGSWVPYYGQEMQEYKQKVIERINKEKPKSKLLSTLQEHNSRGVKYNFPRAVYEDPLAIINERIIPKNRRASVSQRSGSNSGTSSLKGNQEDHASGKKKKKKKWGAKKKTVAT
mmetsp:Transcript_1781/g.2418  ORF Transcript_1781/g.2418 Transcript_1781/m.2418 type:complete len:598 (-) Transcript_1781:48-1841(-)|eukprot:CAMPEP_0117753450 /NCGR_PEP_ID=MMETSP0947-20121206/12225_1 /TAXON_ID=44440 /ORGANISM="Chattonella subsalsa, Strain CCMP2191" /LENGTH=597 /DNA_ID=CAMNT_0005572319 /DNA_START=34 /DNA_END=1830 /DNA_ORIENTATION=-